MRLHDLPFFRVQSSILEQDTVRNAHFTHIVHPTGVEEYLAFRLTHAGRTAQQQAVVAQSPHMQAGAAVPEFSGTRQSIDNFQLRLPQLQGSLLYLFLEDFILLLQRFLRMFEGQMGAHASFQFYQVEGLDDVIHAAQLEASTLVEYFSRGCDENDRHLPGFLTGFDSLTGLEAVHFGHHNIEQNQIDRVFLQQLQSTLPARSDGQSIVILESMHQHIDVIGNVINNENLAAGFGAVHESLPFLPTQGSLRIIKNAGSSGFSSLRAVAASCV